MEPTRCWRCGSAQPHTATPSPYDPCVYCGAQLYRSPVFGRVRWTAHPPPGVPLVRRPKVMKVPYGGPPRYRDRPHWGFAPSVWIPGATAGAEPVPAAPVRELRAVAVLGSSAAVMCVAAAGVESWRYVLLVRGRTEVLPAAVVRVNDAFVMAAGWAALLLAVATGIALIPALGRSVNFAAARALVRPSRSSGQRLILLLVPGWNLYGAGAVFSEVDATLRLEPPLDTPPRRPPVTRWLNRDLPEVGSRQESAAETSTRAAIETADVSEPVRRHRRPGRLVSWWWAAWVVNGLLAAVAVVRGLIPGSLQATADLVELHITLDLVGAGVAALTAAVVVNWVQLMRTRADRWPADWIIEPGPDVRQVQSAVISPSP